MKLVCPEGCTRNVPARSRELYRCDHGLVMVLPGQLKERKPLKRSAPKRRRGGISPASKAQRDKVRDLACLVCGRDRHEGVKVDPAHVWARGKGGCDDADCVVPLCREHHREYEANRLDLLVVLVRAGYWTELAHPTACHEVSPTRLVEELTGQRYIPADLNQLEAAAAAHERSTA